MGILRAIFQFLFRVFLGCRHDHLTRPFTIKQQTYKVCLDCGTHVFYSVQTMQPLRGRELRRIQMMLAGEMKMVPGTDSAQPLNSESDSRVVA
jgi:hypothetical protein